MQKLLITNIKGLVSAGETASTFKRGDEMNDLRILESAWLAIANGRISDFGESESCPEVSDFDIIIDASDRYVLPSWCDSHTHLVYAGSREGEFVDRIKGLSYEDIAKRGGGILNSAKKLAATPEDELFEAAIQRLDEIMMMGTGAVEIKSGYGLSVDAELKMLRVIKRLKQEHPLTIRSTFLGAHAFPPEFKNDHKGYIDLIVNEMLPAVAEQGLAEYVDAFLETGYFSVDETVEIMEAAGKYGLKPKIHVNQFTSIGGIEACVKHRALSVDHLEVMDEQDYRALEGSDTIPALFPGCSFFLSIPYAPAAEMLKRNIGFALATDFNPGSTPSGNMNFVVSAACIKMKILPEAAINAATINGAYAMDLLKTHGSVAKGKTANLFITRPMPSLAYLPYYFGVNPVETVIINGVVRNH